MAEAFLEELLQTTKSIQPDNQDRDCVICLQETGIMNRETGFIELQLRLPCNHVVGSGCISTWLKENNSCPMCRRELFPAQPRPYLEHGIMEGQENAVQEDGDLEDEEQEDEEREEELHRLRLKILEALCWDYCNRIPDPRIRIPDRELAITDGCLGGLVRVPTRGHHTVAVKVLIRGNDPVNVIYLLAKTHAGTLTSRASYGRRSPESLATACVYLACIRTRHIICDSIGASVVCEILMGRVGIQHVIEATLQPDRRMR